jgi:hypothetical protein
MRVVSPAVLLLMLTAGCAWFYHDTPAPEPPVVGGPPLTYTPAVNPTAPTKRRPVPAAAPAPRQKPPAPKPASTVASPVAKAPSAAPTLDLDTLTEQLRHTSAIGFFTKITLKNQVDDLLDKFRGHYAGTTKLSMTELRRSYDLLMMKVLSLLQDKDQPLASAIVSSREAIWGLLSDRIKFATLQS